MPLLHPADDEPERDTDTAAVLEAYGATMLAIQIFEHHLAHLWLWHNKRPNATATERNVRKWMKQAIHVAYTASASELQNGLVGHLHPDLLGEIDRAVSWRNYLAHRALRERLRSQPVPHFVGGTLDEFHELREWFSDLAARLEGLIETYAASVADELDGVPPEVQAAYQQIGWRLWRGDYPDDSPRAHPLPPH